MKINEYNIMLLLKKDHNLSLLSDQEYQTILSFVKQLEFSDNKLILEAGKPWPGLYFIIQGKVRFLADISGQLVAYNTLYADQDFGSLTSENVIDFSVYSTAPSTTLLHLPKQHFKTFLKKKPRKIYLRRPNATGY